MKTFMKKINEKAGYVSVETVIVAGLMIGLGIYIINQLYTNGREMAFFGVDSIESSLRVTIDEGPIV